MAVKKWNVHFISNLILRTLLMYGSELAPVPLHTPYEQHFDLQWSKWINQQINFENNWKLT